MVGARRRFAVLSLSGYLAAHHPGVRDPRARVDPPGRKDGDREPPADTQGPDRDVRAAR